jgi:hypothetical protein
MLRKKYGILVEKPERNKPLEDPAIAGIILKCSLKE